MPNDNNSHLIEKIVPFSQLDVSLQRIETVLGYPTGKSPAHFYKLFNSVKRETQNYCFPRGGYRILEKFSLNKQDASIEVEGKVFKTGKIVNTQINEANFLAVFVCTIGPEMETWANQLLKEGDFLKGYLVDSLASEYVESAMDWIQENLAQSLKIRGLKISNRFSPGYCGWHVAEQHKLFSFLPKYFCDVTLTESALMVPLKSVSGIIGIGKKVKRKEYPCRFCNLQDCVYRRESA
jgi:hypothetical protein